MRQALCYRSATMAGEDRTACKARMARPRGRERVEHDGEREGMKGSAVIDERVGRRAMEGVRLRRRAAGPAAGGLRGAGGGDAEDAE